MTDAQQEYDHALGEFFRRHQGISQDIKDRSWQSFLLWRIAESLEALADTEIVRGIDDIDPPEPWRGEDD